MTKQLNLKNHAFIDHFFYLIKQHAILLGRILRVEYNIGVVMIKIDEPRQTWYC